MYATPEEISDWCRRHLGARPVGDPLFETEQLSQVVGLCLDNGRKAVVKVRCNEPRVAGCAQVQRWFHTAGFACPEILAGPATLAPGLAWTATAEAYEPGGEILATGPGLAARHAGALAKLLRTAPPPEQVRTLDPAPAWVRWDHGRSGIWAPRDDGSDTINEHRIPQWLSDAGDWARTCLALDASPRRVGHLDFEAQNLRWTPDGELHMVHDWDSAAVRTEPTIVGAAAAVFTADGRPGTEATVEQTLEFLDEYQRARGHGFSADELRVAHAAGLWTRAYNAARDDQDGVPGVLDFLRPQVDERLRLAGA